MIDAPPPTVVVDAPAKLNLGLEIVGRRQDGYHDLVTIFQAIDLSDRLTLTATPDGAMTSGLANVPDAENLAVRAAASLRRRFGVASGARIEIAKRIPAASGLGGASSDAAAVLLGARALLDVAASDVELESLAAEIGSDVPFCLRGGTALATGRGERLEPIPTPNAIFVVVSPLIAIPRKTATLYAAIEPLDFSTGDRVREQAHRLRSGQALDPLLLGNAFARPLAEIVPDLAHFAARLRAFGAPNVALSGAGPSHYVALNDPDEAARLVHRLRSDADLGRIATVDAYRPLTQPSRPRRT